MKPFELIAALMHRDGLGALPLAKKMGHPKLQPQIHRFIRGEVASPARTTAVPLAGYFKIPVDAIYEEKLATVIARELGLKPVRVATIKRERPKATKPASEDFDADTIKFAREYAKLDAAGRQRMRLFHMAARTGFDPTKIKKAPSSTKDDVTDSGLGPFDAIPPKGRR